ncbi:B3 domain-containing protein Os01g0723500-like [Diospyros lotus]|uniref:B3 domain-containing protein Os01g0723500-like n=1 Tax=Diospyros lotus TaxID=55363 RepID=UPI002256B33D|nr:B3 domain-containing protein Os01g0723500-like [Diospyros lotus]
MSNSRRPHFFQGFDPTSSSERLKVPSRFVKHMGSSRTSRTVSLVGPSGNTWLVDLIPYNDNLFFDYGWPAFVQDHFLESGDAMVFGYDGNLQFTVQIFDQSSCEKEAALTAECSQDHGHLDKAMRRKRERMDAVSSLDNIVEGMPKKLRESQVKSEEGALCAQEIGVCCSPARNAICFAMPLQSEAPQDVSDTAIQNGLGMESEPGSSVKSCRLMLSVSEAEGLARSFTSSYPNFTKTMKRFNVSGSYTLNIPYQFSMAHLPECKVQIVLHNLRGESWTVNSVPTIKVHTSHTLCGGWMAFVRDNNINMGDICIFELVGRCELRVYILRVGNEGVDCQKGNPVAKELANGLAATPHKISERLPKKKRGNTRKVHLQWITKVEMPNKKVTNSEELTVTKRNQEGAVYLDKASGKGSKIAAFSSRLKARSGKSAMQKKISLEEKLCSYTRGCMSMKSAPEEKKAAQSFVSRFPYFVRVMKKFNISGSYTLKIPYQFSSAHLPDCKTEIVLRNLRGQCWTVNSVPSTRVQTLHTFCGGWMAFVRGNEIQMGDICIFELVGKCEMRVHISGAGKKELDHPSCKSASNE